MLKKSALFFSLAAMGFSASFGDTPVKTPRPIPATRTEMKELLEDMKKRPYRIPLPELTEKEKQELGERSTNYEARLRFNYIPVAEGTVFGAGRTRTAAPAGAPGSAIAPRQDFTRNADENMTLTYQFKTMLFWIVARTNNCQYCLGHQEWKLSATGMSDDAIAALDADWSSYSEAEQAAFAYARLLTYEPHRISDAEIAKVAKHYTPLQIVEMTMSMGGNNAINRWKEGIGIPQSSGNTFAGRGGATAAVEHSDTFLTPTSTRFKDARSIVAPLEIFNGKPSGQGITNRPQLETRDEVLVMLEKIAKRTPRLPLVDEAVAAAWLKDNGQDIPVAAWARLIANFPNEGRGRLPSLASREKQTGDLTELQKAQLNWIIARQDRAWYAIGQAFKTLKSLGQTEDQIFALDGEWKELSAVDQALFRFAKNLAASPIASSDEDAAAALQQTSPGTVVQTVNHVASCAYFNRVTEAAGLAID
jgi:alkylhydroperoxidase family enzyme